jgi:hypothetical protein
MKIKNFRPQVLAVLMFLTGLIVIIISIFFSSSLIVILGVTFLFWGVILLYIKPTKHVPLTLLNAIAFSAAENIERILAKTNFSGKGKYLPPKFAKDFESSVIFIPKESGIPIMPEKIADEKKQGEKQEYIFITPPGLAISEIFEEAIGISFVKTTLSFVKKILPKLITYDLELAQMADLSINHDSIILKLKGNALKQNNVETSHLLRYRNQVGCIFSSAVACVLAKASGKAVTVEKDELSEDGQTTIMEFKLWDI